MNRPELPDADGSPAGRATAIVAAAAGQTAAHEVTSPPGPRRGTGIQQRRGVWLAEQPELIAAARAHLSGYDLACYCPLDGHATAMCCWTTSTSPGAHGDC